MYTDSLESRIARKATTMAVLWCLIGAAVWAERWTDALYGRELVVAHLIGAIAMLGVRVWLDGADLETVTRYWSRGRSNIREIAAVAPRPSARTRKVAASLALVLLMITSLPAPFADLSGTQSTFAATGNDTQANLAEATSADGSTIYSASQDNTVKAIDAESGTVNWTFEGHTDNVVTIAASPDGSTIYSGAYDNTVKAIDAETGEEVWSFDGHSDGVDALSVSPDGSTVYSGSHDGTVKAIDAEAGTEQWSFEEHTADVKSLAASPDGSTIYSASQDNTVKAIDAKSGTEQWTFDGHSDSVRHIAASPDGSTVYSGSADATVKAIDSETGTEEWSFDGHSSTIQTVTVSPDGGTVYSGGYDNMVRAIDAENGSEEWSFDGHSGAVLSIAPSADGSTIYSGSADDTVKAIDAETQEVEWTFEGHSSGVYGLTAGHPFPTSTGADINGTVENQDGQPVDNATVTVTGIDREELDADAGELNAEAEEILNELEDPTPPNWSADRTLTGSDGLFTEADAKYVAAHPKEDWGLARYTDEPQLGNPQVQLPANEEIALSVWDPDEGGLVQDGVESDLPGGVDDDTDIVVESIDHEGGTVDKRTIETDTTYDVGLAGGEHDLATTELPAGFYRVYPEDNPETSYVIVVGDPKEIANTIRGDLKDEAGQLTAQAERVQEYKDQDVLKEYTTTTDENGSFSVDVPDSVTRVSVQAHKTPPGMNEDPQNASLQDVRDYYAVTDYNGSYVMPAEADTHSVPANGITVDTVETEAPQFADLGRYSNATEAFQAMLQNMSYSELPTSLQQRLEDVDREELEENANELQRLTNENSDLEERVEELSDRDLENINDSSDEELREQIQAQQQAISELRSTIETQETDTEVSDGLASSTATFGQDLSKDQIRVVANFQNGTSQEVSDEYISLDHSAGTIAGDGATEVAVEDYPLGDASGVTFDYVVVTEDGIGETTTNAVKPGEDSIGLDAISLSSLRPGPDEQVDVTLVGDDDTQVAEITDVRAVSPDGEELDTSTEGADTATFTTDGEGRHFVEVEFETASGEEGTLTHRIAAGEDDRAMPPGIRVKDTPFGTVAVVGDGYEAGSVDISNGGQTIDVTAQVGSDEDAPARTHLYAHGTDLPPTSTLNVNIVRGDQQRAVQRHVEVTAHLPAIRTENAVLYRNGEALPRDGEGKLADVSTSSDETTIVTVTDARGSLELETNSDPGLIERGEWWIDRNTPEFSLGVLGQLPVLPTVPMPDLTAVIDTGPIQVAAPAPTIDGPSAVGVPA